MFKLLAAECVSNVSTTLNVVADSGQSYDISNRVLFSLRQCNPCETGMPTWYFLYRMHFPVAPCRQLYWFAVV